MDNDNTYCPECGIGLNNREIDLCFCQNCKANWKDDVDNYFRDQQNEIESDAAKNFGGL